MGNIMSILHSTVDNASMHIKTSNIQVTGSPEYGYRVCTRWQKWPAVCPARARQTVVPADVTKYPTFTGLHHSS